jgi:hypothetical protein
MAKVAAAVILVGSLVVVQTRVGHQAEAVAAVLVAVHSVMAPALHLVALRWRMDLVEAGVILVDSLEAGLAVVLVPLAPEVQVTQAAVLSAMDQVQHLEVPK